VIAYQRGLEIEIRKILRRQSKNATRLPVKVAMAASSFP
jgi:hypothetical protein